MSETTHTPEPWRLGSTARVILGPIGQRIATVTRTEDDTDGKNARLIVHAPDLLSMLSMMLSSCQFGESPSWELQKQCSALIAKAKGE